MKYRDFKDLPKRATSDKLLQDKALEIGSNPKNEINVDWHQWSTTFFDKKAGDTSTQIGTGVPENQELAKGLHRFITIKCERAKVHWLYWDNIWAADLANIQLIDKYNKGIRLWRVLLIFKANVGGLFSSRKEKVFTMTS